MKRSSFGLIATVLALYAGQARAQDTADEPGGSGSGHWSVLTGRTVGEGVFVVHPEVGYPGISGTFVYGTSNRVDVGGRFGFDYGSKYGVGIAPGLLMQGLVKLHLGQKGKLSVALMTQPGLGFYFGDPVVMAILFPIYLQMGIHATEAFAIVIGADLEMGIGIILGGTGGVGFAMPIGFGPGFEYKVDDSLALTMNMRFGPSIIALNGGVGVNFLFKALLGVAVKI
jgi:hypothetical protein